MVNKDVCEICSYTLQHSIDYQGRLSPPTTLALSPHSHVSPLFMLPPTPQTIYGHCIRNPVQFMRVFSGF